MDFEPIICRLKIDFHMTWEEIYRTTPAQALMLFSYKKRIDEGGLE